MSESIEKTPAHDACNEVQRAITVLTQGYFHVFGYEADIIVTAMAHIVARDSICSVDNTGNPVSKTAFLRMMAKAWDRMEPLVLAEKQKDEAEKN